MVKRGTPILVPTCKDAVAISRVRECEVAALVSGSVPASCRVADRHEQQNHARLEAGPPAAGLGYPGRCANRMVPYTSASLTRWRFCFTALPAERIRCLQCGSREEKHDVRPTVYVIRGCCYLTLM